MNIQQMMKQAQQMQARLQQQMAETRVEATAGGGMVTVVMNGAKQIQSLAIDRRWSPRMTSRCFKISSSRRSTTPIARSTRPWPSRWAG